MKHLVFAAAVVATSFWSLCFAEDAVQSTRLSQLQQSLRASAAADISDATRASIVKGEYASFKRAGDGTAMAQGRTLSRLIEEFEGANIASFYLSDIDSTKDLMAVASELRARNQLTLGESSKVYEALLAARMFSEAVEWHRRNVPGTSEDFSFIDATRSNIGATVLNLVDGGLQQKRFDLPPGPFVIVVAHPLCHFSQFAISALEADKDLSAYLGSHSAWISPQQRGLYLPEIRQWNAEHPASKISIAFEREKWDVIDLWETPTFYFLYDGKPIKKIIGWPREGRMESVRTAIDELRQISRGDK